MKIGILSLVIHQNYGGILQAFALQTVLEDMGHQVEILNRPPVYKHTNFIEVGKRIVKRIIGKDVVIFEELRYRKEAKIINSKVWDFRRKYLKERIVNSLEDVNTSDYDCIIVGSDQVWRPLYFKSQWDRNVSKAFLSFTKGWNIKRIAYAASFGVDNWEYNLQETLKCKDLIKDFDAVSCRENAGVSLLENKFGIHSTNVLDPTLLIGKKRYLDLIKQENNRRGNSLLVYFLDPNNRKDELAERISREKGLHPFSVNNCNVKKKTPIQDRILPSVEFWLKGFSEADFIVTDSFHACVFSIIFNKPFVVIGNKERGLSRFDFLGLIGLKSNLLLSTEDYNSKTDYSVSKNTIIKLEELKNESMAFLYGNLKK